VGGRPREDWRHRGFSPETAEPRVVTVRFGSDGFELVDEPRDFDRWIREEFDEFFIDPNDAREVPPWFWDAFRVRLSN
jgi:hypothetical protein